MSADKLSDHFMDEDYDNTVLRVFMGKAIETCEVHGTQDRVLMVNNGMNGQAELYCFGCFQSMIKRFCVEFNKFKPDDGA